MVVRRSDAPSVEPSTFFGSLGSTAQGPPSAATIPVQVRPPVAWLMNPWSCAPP